MSTTRVPPRTRGVILWRVMLIAYLPAYLLGLYWPHLSLSGPLIADLARSLPGSLSWHLHGVGHVVLTLLLIGALPHWRNGGRLAMLVAGLVAFAGLAEAAQAWVPGRSPTLLDFLFNAAGIAVALAGFLAARSFTARRPPAAGRVQSAPLRLTPPTPPINTRVPLTTAAAADPRELRRQDAAGTSPARGGPLHKASPALRKDGWRPPRCSTDAVRAAERPPPGSC